MSEEATTRPTLETLLERINALGERMDEGFTAIVAKLDKMAGRLDRLETAVHELRGDFNEFRAQFKAPA